MTAHDQIRAMLDQLMGTSRNGEDDDIAPNGAAAPGGSKAEKPKRLRFDDTRVCKSFLLHCCPHEILASTRMDLGECPKVHNFALRADYEKASKEKDYFYDLEALSHLHDFVSESDRKTEQAKKRLAETQELTSEFGSSTTSEVAQKAERVNELAEEIGGKLAKAEALGEQGEVDESMKLMEEIDGLRKLKAEAEAEYRKAIPPAAYQQQKLRVCEVCCAYLGIHDNDRRLADHFGGKLHLGFIKIRETLKEFQVTADERRRVKRNAHTNRRDEGNVNFGGIAGGGDPVNRDRDRDNKEREERRRHRHEHDDRQQRKGDRSGSSSGRSHRRHDVDRDKRRGDRSSNNRDNYHASSDKKHRDRDRHRDHERKRSRKSRSRSSSCSSSHSKSKSSRNK